MQDFLVNDAEFEISDIPAFVQENSRALSFPEKLMFLLVHVERGNAKAAVKPDHFPISWSPDGKAFVIRDKDAFLTEYLPTFFGRCKFSSFTRKLYRWGFRRIQHVGANQDHIYFGHEYFQRDQKLLMSKMESNTSEKRRARTKLFVEVPIDSEGADAHNSEAPNIPSTTVAPFPYAESQQSLDFRQKIAQVPAVSLAHNCTLTVPPLFSYLERSEASVPKALVNVDSLQAVESSVREYLSTPRLLGLASQQTHVQGTWLYRMPDQVSHPRHYGNEMDAWHNRESTPR